MTTTIERHTELLTALHKELLEVERAKYRDSNDGEIDALRSALDTALALLADQGLHVGLSTEETTAIYDAAEAEWA